MTERNKTVQFEVMTRNLDLYAFQGRLRQQCVYLKRINNGAFLQSYEQGKGNQEETMNYQATIHSGNHITFSTEEQVERIMLQDKTGIGAVEKGPLERYCRPGGCHHIE